MNIRFASILAIGATLLLSTLASGFDIVNRWSETQLDGGGLQRGDPTTLRWSVVTDGESYERSENSNLIQFLDDGWNIPASERTPDFRNREWWNVMNTAYMQYGRVSGVSLVYVPEKSNSGASTGLVGDIRIGGETIDGTAGGTLADNVFPNGGDMRIDTSRELDGSVSGFFSSEPGLRNLVIHETGHGVGLGHVEFLNNSGFAVMEGGLRTDFWGLQFDDIYGLNRQYGDPQEQGIGNNTPTTATQLGSLGIDGSVSVGRDADDIRVEQFDGDWLGIDGTNDLDWFEFNVSGESFASLKLTPKGPTYETEQQGVFNAAAQSDLVLQVFSSSPSLTLIGSADFSGVGGSEMIPAQYLEGPGDYLLRVRGKQDLNQFYQIDLSVSELPLPGSSADINLDGVADFLDWATLVEYSGTSTQLLSQRDAYMLGDLNFDGTNDYQDFVLFKSAFALTNGPTAFAALLRIPEPGTASLILLYMAMLLVTGSGRTRYAHA